MKAVKVLQLSNGKIPYRDWYERLDKGARRKISGYIERVALGGSTKNVRALGNGVFEIKIDYGPGYRVYFAEEKKMLMLILLGGDKSTQFCDIQQAKKYWREYASK